MVLKDYSRDDVIFYKGDPGTCMYDIVQGKVAIYAEFGSWNARKLRDLTAGQLFGEMALIDGRERSATAIADADGTVVHEISQEELERCLREEPAMVLRILKHLSACLEAQTRDFREACETIRDMRDTGNGRRERPAGLLAGIARMVRTSRFFSGTGTGKGGIAAGDAKTAAPAPESSGGTVRRKRGEVICRRGDPGLWMYYIREGSVELCTGYGTPKEKRRAVIHAGEYFGELGLLEKQPRSSDAVAAADDTVLWIIRETELEQILSEQPETGMKILRCFSDRIRKQTERFLQACDCVAAMETAEREGRLLEDFYDELSEELAAEA